MNWCLSNVNLFFTRHCGAEKTRDELRRQVYDAMAEKEKTEAVDTKLESEDGKGNTESSGKHVNGSGEPSSSPISGKATSSVQKAKVNGVEKSQVAPVNGVEESPAASPVKEATMEKVKDSKEQNGKKTDSKPEAEQDDEEPEGSKSLDIEHCLC